MNFRRFLASVLIALMVQAPLLAQSIGGAIPNNTFYQGVDQNAIARNMIGMDTSGRVSIDSGARGAILAGAVTVTGALTVTGAQTFTGATSFSSGTAALPGITWTGDTDLGIFRNAANDMRVVVGSSVEAMQWTADGVIINEGGTAAMDFRVEADTTANSLFHDATGIGAWAFGTATTSGYVTISRPSGSAVGFVVTTGGVTVNMTSLSGATGMAIDGTVVLAGSSTSATGAYLCLDTSTNIIGRSSSCTLSSSKYKNDITTMTDMGLSTILSLRPVTFISKIFPEEGVRPGLIAEEVAAVEPRLVRFASDGRPESVHYIEYTAVLTRAIQELEERLAVVEKR